MNCREPKPMNWRLIGTKALVSSHANGEAPKNQKRAGRKAPERRHGPSRNLADLSLDEIDTVYRVVDGTSV